MSERVPTDGRSDRDRLAVLGRARRQILDGRIAGRDRVLPLRWRAAGLGLARSRVKEGTMATGNAARSPGTKTAYASR